VLSVHALLGLQRDDSMEVVVVIRGGDDEQLRCLGVKTRKGSSRARLRKHDSWDYSKTTGILDLHPKALLDSYLG
jgi:hypothetical protein